MGKESEQMHQDEFKEIFELFMGASKDEQNIFPGWQPINFSNPADMGAIQKVLEIRGAAKVYNVFAIASLLCHHIS